MFCVVKKKKSRQIWELVYLLLSCIVKKKKEVGRFGGVIVFFFGGSCFLGVVLVWFGLLVYCILKDKN